MEKKSENEEKMEEKVTVEEPENKTVPLDAASQESGEEKLRKELLYQRAEFDNYRKRIVREQEQSIKFANEKFVRELLTVVDQLDRAMAHSKPLKARKDDKEVETFLSGLEMTQRDLVQLLSRFGVEFIGAPGEKFDPSRHEAITQAETTEDKVETVLEVLQKGSLFHGRLLQPAKVVVGKSKKEK